MNAARQQTKARARVGAAMLASGHPVEFVVQVLRLSEQHEGVEDLLYLWLDAQSTAEQRACVAAMQDALDTREVAHA